MLFDEPTSMPAPSAITAPTLVLASDHDLIRDEHTLEIYHHIRNSQLAFSERDPHDSLRRSALFDATVERFFREPSWRRIG